MNIENAKSNAAFNYALRLGHRSAQREYTREYYGQDQHVRDALGKIKKYNQGERAGTRRDRYEGTLEDLLNAA